MFSAVSTCNIVPHRLEKFDRGLDSGFDLTRAPSRITNDLCFSFFLPEIFETNTLGKHCFIKRNPLCYFFPCSFEVSEGIATSPINIYIFNIYIYK